MIQSFLSLKFTEALSGRSGSMQISVRNGTRWNERNIKFMPEFEIQRRNRFRNLPRSKNFFPGVTVMQYHFSPMPVGIQ